MAHKSFFTILKTEAILYMRGFFGPFFSFAFPVMMLLLFGSIYGNDPTPFYGGKGAMDVGVPSYLGLVIAVSGLMSLPLQLAEYQTNHVYKRFDATPVGKEKIIAAQLSLYFFASFIGSLMLILIGKSVYHIHIDGSPVLIIIVFLLSLVSMFSIGFFIAAVFKNAKIINLVSYLLYFLMLFTSGATIPVELFPDHVKFFTRFMPLTHAVEILKHSFAGNWQHENWISVIILSVISLVCGTTGIIFYRRRRWS